MLAPMTPIIIPPVEDGHDKRDGCLARRHAVIMISLVEVVVSAGIASLYIYALACRPKWAEILVPIPKELCNTKSIVDGVMFIIILLSTLELLMALYLFEGARRECLSRARFWLSSMFTYMILVSVVILGLDLGGIKEPSLNVAAFINIFARFLEILIVFSWTEQESMKRLRFRGISRRSLAPGVSTMTISTVASGVMQAPSSGLGTIVDCEPATPPPSYQATIPEGEILLESNAGTHQRQEPVLMRDDEETERTEIWKKQWE